MSRFKRVTDDFYVSPQISESDLSDAKGEGFVSIIANRPDRETPDQPAMDALSAAAGAAGLQFGMAAISGPPSEADVDAMARVMADAPGKTLAFCRSGTRSTMLWALVEARKGEMSVDDILSAAKDAGYDLGGMRARLEAAHPGKA